MPTLDEINAAAPDTPVFILHLYDRAWLNKAALRAVGYTKDTPEPPGGEIQRDKQGNPTGLLIARPNAKILYDTLAKGPKLAPEDQVNSTRLFMREMNRFGITSCIDAGGGYQNYPDDYKVISDLAKAGQLTVRIAYNLFTQRPKQEKEDFAKWVKMAKPGEGDAFYRMNGAGEMLVYSAADFEDFLEPRPDLPKTMEAELTEVVTILAKNRWPFRLHATYDETIARSLDVFEAVNREVPFNGLRWFFDHAETISEKKHRAHQGARRRHRRAAPNGLSGRVLHRPLWQEGGGALSAHQPDVEAGGPGRRGHGRHARRQLQPLGLPVLARQRQDGGRHSSLPGGEPARPDGSPAALHRRQRVVLRRGGQEGVHRSRQAGGPRRAVGRLLRSSRRGDQADRVGPDGRRRQGGVRGGGLCEARPAGAARQPRLVADQGVRRLSP